MDDLTNQRFGRLIAIKRAKNRGRKHYWNCLCDCGNKKVIQKYSLTSGNTKSCGCLAAEKKCLELAGKTFGRLTVVERDKKRKKGWYWFCICECGTRKSLLGSSVMSGHTRSCGCLRGAKCLEFEKGQTFGRLTTIKQDKTRNNRSYWLCSCICGNETSVRGSEIKAGHIRSCGCLNIEKISQRFRLENPWTVNKNIVIKRYKKRAKGLGLPFELTDKDCELLFKSNCGYCQAPPSNVQNIYLNRRGIQINKKANFLLDLKTCDYLYNGIDRKDNAKGYLKKKDQCIPCCKNCNRGKSDATWEEWQDYLFRVANNGPTNNELANNESSKIAQREIVIITERQLPSFNALLSGYRKNAEGRDLCFELSTDQCHLLFQGICYYCGIPPSNTTNRYINKNGDYSSFFRSLTTPIADPEKALYLYNGIDRISQFGYFISNCVSCCVFCNRTKGALEKTEWNGWLSRIKKLYARKPHARANSRPGKND